MGRGRRGIVEQSQKKPKRNSLIPRKNEEMIFHTVDWEKGNSMFLNDDILQELKKMEPKDAVAALLRN